MANYDNGTGMSQSGRSHFAIVSAEFEDEVAAGSAARHLHQAGVDEVDISTVTVAGGVQPAAVKVVAATTGGASRGLEKILLILGGADVHTIIQTAPQGDEMPRGVPSELLRPEADVLEQAETASPAFAVSPLTGMASGPRPEADVSEQNMPVPGDTVQDEGDARQYPPAELVPEADVSEQATLVPSVSWVEDR